MKATVTDACIACGVCADICPDVFEMAGDRAKVIVEEAPTGTENACREAAESCPVDAIELDE